jgi:hypothetical protein
VHPYYEGTGALYLRFSKDDDRVAAYVARPPAHSNKGTRNGTSQPRKDIVALGNMGYVNVTNAIMGTIGDLARSVQLWNKFVEGEEPAVTEKRKDNQREVEKATRMINHLNQLHNEVTKRRTNPDQQIIGSVLHVEPIVVADGPHGYTRDWAFIELHHKRFDWSTFTGNNVYVGTFPISLVSQFRFWLTLYPRRG